MQYLRYTKILIEMSNKLELEFQQLCKTNHDDSGNFVWLEQ